MNFEPLQPYFSEKERWGDSNRVQWYHIHHLWMIRTGMIVRGYNWPMIINRSFDLNSGEKSQHRLGLATDFYFKINLSIRLQFSVLLDVIGLLNLGPYMGFGVYPHWNTPGFHLDSRGSRVMWVRDEKKEYHYGLNTIHDYFKEYNL